MAMILLAASLLVALLGAHAWELRKVASARQARKESTRSQVDECLANIDHVIDLRLGGAARYDEPLLLTSVD